MEKIKKYRKIIIIIAVLTAIVSLVAWNVRGNGNGETIVVERGDLIKTVELAGKVIPEKEVDLAFEESGSVAFVNKKVGDYVSIGESIAILDQSKVQADLSKVEADLNATKLEFSDSKTNLVQSIMDAYTKADDAIHNKVDQFFTDGSSRNPEILNYFDDNSNIRSQINNDRIFVEDLLVAWKAEVSKLNTNTYTDEYLKKALSRLESINIFLNKVSVAVNNFEINSGLTQTTIDKYRTDFATARQNVNNAKSSLISGSAVKLARIDSAQAVVNNYETTLSRMTLRSPISGIISKQDAKVGEAVSANSPIVSVMSFEYKIEAYVPEVSFAGIALGNKAVLTLDAYGDSVVFDAVIKHIDPRETIRDGVSTYKIELTLSKPDDRIKSGMTANIQIETDRKADVLILPLRSVLKSNGQNTVLVRDADGQKIEKNIEIGNVDSNGRVEIVSGLSLGDIVFLSPTK